MRVEKWFMYSSNYFLTKGKSHGHLESLFYLVAIFIVCLDFLNRLLGVTNRPHWNTLHHIKLSDVLIHLALNLTILIFTWTSFPRVAVQFQLKLMGLIQLPLHKWNRLLIQCQHLLTKTYLNALLQASLKWR